MNNTNTPQLDKNTTTTTDAIINKIENIKSSGSPISPTITSQKNNLVDTSSNIKLTISDINNITQPEVAVPVTVVPVIVKPQVAVPVAVPVAVVPVIAQTQVPVVPVIAQTQVPVAVPVVPVIAQTQVAVPVAVVPVIAQTQVPVAPVIAQTQVAVPVAVAVVPVIAQPPHVVPELVFIVPYRDRETHYAFFSDYMKNVLENKNYRIYYIHQCDTREFNRGAMKNIGFLMVKSLFPEDYQNITLVFNDIDTLPESKDLFDYKTEPGTVKHFFGFTHTLGGIVSITASDFEKTTGFANFWSWGYEDNVLLNRVNSANLVVDRSKFFEKGDSRIIQLSDGIFRNINRVEFDWYMRQTTEGFHSISELEYDIDDKGFVNVRKFNTPREENPDLRKVYDLRNGNTPFPESQPVSKKSTKMRMVML